MLLIQLYQWFSSSLANCTQIFSFVIDNTQYKIRSVLESLNFIQLILLYYQYRYIVIVLNILVLFFYMF